MQYCHCALYTALALCRVLKHLTLDTVFTLRPMCITAILCTMLTLSMVFTPYIRYGADWAVVV